MKSLVVMRALVFGVAVLLLAGRAQATVYSWRDSDGSYHFTNQSADVPPGQLEAFRTVTEAQPAPSQTDGAAADPPPASTDDPPSGYAQGLEAGLRIGEEQIRIAGELAREIAESAPAAPAAPVVFMPPPAPIVVNVAPSVDAGCGQWGYCGGYGYGYNSWIVGPAFFARPFFRHGRFFRGGHRFGDTFGNRSFFAGGLAGGFPGGFRGGLGGGFAGGQGPHGGGRFAGRR